MEKKIIRYFTPGPVEMADHISAIGGEQVPYFRNERFSQHLLECEEMLLTLAKAPKGSRALFLASSGTGAMEAAIANFASAKDPSVIINSQGFGQRLVDICHALNRPVNEIKLSLAEAFKESHASDIPIDNCGAVICNAHDTVSGVLHHLPSLGASTKSNKNALFIVDAISSFLCDPIDMTQDHIDILIIGSQKALALPPGLAILIISPKAIDHLLSENHKPDSYYFDLRPYLSNGTRGQTPFTPSVGIIMQLHTRLLELVNIGIDQQVEATQKLATYFRDRLTQAGLPFKLYPDVASNGITALECLSDDIDAEKLVRDIDKIYDLYLTPNGGDLRHCVFRISHMGVQTTEALDMLVDTLQDYLKQQKALS